MADLDDFFAKKDRKKTKGKKFATAEDIVKKFEQEKKSEKLKKDIKSVVVGDENIINNQQEDEEWKEFEEEKKDYTGLKLQNLSFADPDTSDTTEGETADGELEENEQGELIPRKKGPWKTIDVDNLSDPEEKSVELSAPVPVPPSGATPARTSSAYVPPHLQRQSQAPRGELRVSRTKGAAPDISNTEFFPTLTAANNETPNSWARNW